MLQTLCPVNVVNGVRRCWEAARASVRVRGSLRIRDGRPSGDTCCTIRSGTPARLGRPSSPFLRCFTGAGDSGEVKDAPPRSRPLLTFPYSVHACATRDNGVCVCVHVCVLTVASIVNARSFTSRTALQQRLRVGVEDLRIAYRRETISLARARARAKPTKYGNRAKPRWRERWRCSRGIRRRCQGRRASSLVSTQPGHGQPGRTSHTQRQRTQRAETTDAGRDRAREAFHQSAGEYADKKRELLLYLSPFRSFQS